MSAFIIFEVKIRGVGDVRRGTKARELLAKLGLVAV